MAQPDFQGEYDLFDERWRTPRSSQALHKLYGACGAALLRQLQPDDPRFPHATRYLTTMWGLVDRSEPTDLAVAPIVMASAAYLELDAEYGHPDEPEPGYSAADAQYMIDAVRLVDNLLLEQLA